MWFDDATIYQIYPLGLCGAPLQNDGSDQTGEHRILRVLDWVEHIKKLGATCVLFNPLFDSDAHGYDTRDYNRVDPRLGTKEDFQAVCKALHEAGIRVMLDGVFNHVGRGFWAFRDVQEKKWDSPYKDWFHLNFDGNSAYNDGFWYEGWEGHYELVKLNLYNPTVVEYLLNCVGRWIDEFGIDGLRLDVAYMLNEDFMRRLRAYCDGKKPEFVNGLRVTDKETVDIVQMVLAGKVNKELVALLAEHQGSAVGLCGIDGQMLMAEKVESEQDLGYVGDIVSVNTKPILDALNGGYVPVIATVASSKSGQTYNVNADTAAARIAAELKAENLILMTDIAGLMRDKDDPSTLMPFVNISEVPFLKRQGIISGGMIPKIDCCVEAVRRGVERAHIIDGRTPHSILVELFTDEGIGTMFY